MAKLARTLYAPPLVALALVLSGASVAGCADEPPPVEEDMSVEELKKTLALPALRSVRAFDVFSTEGGGFGQAGRVLKYFIDVRSGGSRTYFINANYEENGKQY